MMARMDIAEYNARMDRMLALVERMAAFNEALLTNFGDPRRKKLDVNETPVAAPEPGSAQPHPYTS